MVKTLEALKAYFYEHAYPTWQQFHDVLDSFRHKSDKIPIADVDGLNDQLNGRVTEAQLNAEIQARTDADTTLQTDIETKVGWDEFNEVIETIRPIYQKSFVDDSTDGVMNESTYINEGKNVFLLPEDMDLTHDYTIYDGGVMVEPAIDYIARTATFDVVPLAYNGTKKNKITYKYYKIVN